MAKKKKDDPIIEEEVEQDDQDFRSGQASTTQDDQTLLVTKEGLKKLQEELENLKNVRRKEVSGRLKEAISYGDLSENSEYEEAKNEQAFIEGRILELENQVKNAKVVKGHTTKGVQIGSIVKLKKVGSSNDEQYTIVGTTEADPFENKISNESPIGHAIMELKKGDKVTVETPSGKQRYEITSLK
ncbi:MAG: transcription elongation factor GreA [Candidatus Gracilibacteria bacterium]|nr:transcription elongation factor GreA [Candidatus Gracilibacteria bacterium]